MPHVRTKICGLCTADDAREAVRAGADALGLVFAGQSRRRIDVAQARVVRDAIGPFVARVGLFMNDTAATVEQAVAGADLDMLQFHGDETPAFCRSFGRPYMKAVAMGDGKASVQRAANDYHDAAALLLDGHSAGQPGGQGEAFDWQIDLSALVVPVVIAGGLTPANVGQAIAALSPYAVDVSSGVEDAPGRKSATKMHAFIDAVQKAGQS